MFNSLNTIVGYPENLINDEEVENYYKNLEINSGDFLNSFLNASKFKDTKIKLNYDINDWTLLTKYVTNLGGEYEPFSESKSTNIG